MSAILNTHVYPPGGYYFVDAEGVRFEAENTKKLAQRVKEYRFLNGKQAGDPEQEINDFTCARYPTGCRDKDARPLKPSADHIPLAARVTRWLAIIVRALGRNPGAYVSKAEANRRAAICLTCSQQADWRSGCGPCQEATNRLAFSARRGMEAIDGGQLKACSILGEDTRTSVFLDGLKPSDRPELPKHCWRKAT